MLNLEYKAAISDPEALMTKVCALGGEVQSHMTQTDTYFDVRHGRMKLRETPTLPAELISYSRDEASSERHSNYEVARTDDPEALREVLARALPILCVVQKQRTLVLLDNVRVHVDEVQDLGDFVELEVPVLGVDRSAARHKLDRLLQELNLDVDRGIRASYADLLLAKRGKDADLV